MLDISNNKIITMTRGDTVTIPFYLFSDNADKLADILVYPNIYDKIFFSIMEPNQKFEDAIVKKIYKYDDIDSEGCLNIKLESYETQFLTPGLYYYTVKILRKEVFPSEEEEPADSTGEVETLIGTTRFYIVD